MNAKSKIPFRITFLPSLLLLALLCSLSLSACPLDLVHDGESLKYNSGATLVLDQGWKRYSGFLDEAFLDGAHAPTPVGIHARITPSLLEPPSSLAGPVTYRLTVEKAPGEKRYGIFLPGAAKYASIRVNGKVLYRKGQDEAPGSAIQFSSSESRLSIILQSDAEGPRLEAPGLLPQVILLGEEKGLLRLLQLVSSAAAVEIGFFMLTGLFVFILFLFWQRNRDFLTLAAFLWGSGLFTLGETGSFFGLNSLPGTWISLISLLCSLLFLLPLAGLVGFAFKEGVGRIAKYGSLAITLALAAASFLVLFFPGTEHAVYLAASAWYTFFITLSTVFLAIAAGKKERRAYWLLPSTALCLLAMTGHRFLPSSLAASFFMEPAGLIVFSFAAMLVLIKKIGDSFEVSDTLSDYVSNVTTTMRRFIPREFLECLNKEDVVDLKLGDHVKKEMTIFFSDIRSFTELSERLTVEENFAFINSYLSRVVPILAENGGFVDKYIGDGIMALFAGEKGPDQAIRAAIAMQEKIVEYNGHRASCGYRPIAMGVGVHTGDLMLGVIGVDDRMENTVISDAVNLASRLQSITKAFNISLAISEQAFKELEDPGEYKYRFIGKVKVKGKTAPVSVFEIFDGIAPELFEKKMKANTYFEQGMLSYYQKDFSGAMYYFKRVLEIMPEDGAAAFYLENCISKAAL